MSGNSGEEIHFLPQPEIELRFLGRSGFSLVNILIELLRFPASKVYAVVSDAFIIRFSTFF